MRDRKFFMFFNFVFLTSHELFLTAKIYQITVHFVLYDAALVVALYYTGWLG